MPRLRRILRVLLIVLLAGSAPTLGSIPRADPPSQPDPPRPDLSRLEPSIVRQVETLQELVEERRKAGAPATELAETWGTLGHLYTYYDLAEPAEDAYAIAHRLAPEDFRWLYYLGFLVEDLGRLEEAAEHLRDSLALEPGQPAALVRLGRVELALGRPDAAEEHFRRVVEIDDSLAAGWHGLGEVAARRGDDQRAVELFRRALELQPEADLVYYALGQALRRTGDLEAARAALEKRGGRRVSFPDPLVERISDASVISSLDLVRSLAADREGFPDLRFLNYTMSILASVDGVIERMEQELAAWPAERREADRVQRARLHYALGGLLIHRDRGEEARRHLHSALELLPDLTDARVKLANSLARARQLDAAAGELSTVLEADPDHAAARLKRAAVWMGLDRWQEARRDLVQLVETDPGNHEVRGRLALTLERLGRPAEALEHYQAAARLDPDNQRAAGAHLQAAGMLLARERADEAITELQRAVDLDPSLVDARITLAGLMVRSQRFTEALEQFEAVLEVAPEALPAHLGRATVLLLLERYPEARRALEDSRATLPGNPAIELLLARLLAAAPDPAVRDATEAARLARQLDQRRPTPRSAEARALAAAAAGDFPEALTWQQRAVERARTAGQERLAAYLAQRLPLYEAGRPWSPRGPGELIVLPNEG